MRAKLDHVDEVAKNIKMFWFTPDHKPDQIPGQFVELRLKHPKPDNRGDSRWFTLTSSPTEDKIAITTKFIGEPLGSDNSSFKKALLAIKPGQEIMFTEPMGDFTLPSNKSIPLVFVAGGIGVTPMRSMVKWLHDRGEKRDIQVIYAANTLEEVAFADLFKDYGAKLDIVPSKPPANWKGPAGRLNGEKVKDIAGKLDGKLIYLSGPEPMTEALSKNLAANGISKKQIITDFFPGYTGI